MKDKDTQMLSEAYKQINESNTGTLKDIWNQFYKGAVDRLIEELGKKYSGKAVEVLHSDYSTGRQQWKREVIKPVDYEILPYADTWDFIDASGKTYKLHPSEPIKIVDTRTGPDADPAYRKAARKNDYQQRGI